MTLWLFRGVVLVHMFVCLGNAACFFALPFIEPPWISLPCCSLIFFLTFQREVQCPMTNYENKLRKDLGMRPIRGFVGHYILLPFRLWSKEQRKTKAYQSIKTIQFQGVETHPKLMPIQRNRLSSLFHSFL